MAWWGQLKATAQFYLYGRSHFTRTGYLAHRRQYEAPDILEDLDLSGRVFMVTGASSGLGRELTRYFASRKATVYMVCRSRERGEEALRVLAAEAGGSSGRLHLLLADVGLEADVRRMWEEFVQHFEGHPPRLDALVCNAGAMASDLTLTEEGVEVTFASHLLFGTYLLGTLAMPALKASSDGRIVVVSSGGMYNVPFPSWEVATATASSRDFKFNGQIAYAYAKRGQVLLCERWAAMHSSLKVVSCHPGWARTPGVDAAYGASKSWLEPLRSLWEGTEGIAWLCAAPGTEIQSGAFYLDRRPQAKHMAGLFFTEGSYTKNSPEEVEAMLVKLEDWANGRRPPSRTPPQRGGAAVPASEPPEGTGQRSPSPPLEERRAEDRPAGAAALMACWLLAGKLPSFAPWGSTSGGMSGCSYDVRKIATDLTCGRGELGGRWAWQQRAEAARSLGARRRWLATKRLSPKLGVRLPLDLPHLVLDCARRRLG